MFETNSSTEIMRIRVFRHFAKLHRVHTRRDECGELIISGKRGHVYDHGDGRFGILLMLPTAKRWGFARRKMIAAGYHVRQSTHSEGTALFDPADSTQVRLAFRLAGVKRRRMVSDEVRQRLARTGERLRNGKTPSQESEMAAQEPSICPQRGMLNPPFEPFQARYEWQLANRLVGFPGLGISGLRGALHNRCRSQAQVGWNQLTY